MFYFMLIILQINSSSIKNVVYVFQFECNSLKLGRRQSRPRNPMRGCTRILEQPSGQGENEPKFQSGHRHRARGNHRKSWEVARASTIVLPLLKTRFEISFSCLINLDQYLSINNKYSKTLFLYQRALRKPRFLLS